MLKTTLTIRAAGGSEFDCYLVAPHAEAPVPAIVLACTIHGVDDDLRGIADALAAHGYLAAAPDLFWRTTPHALARDDPRAAARAQPRLERIRAGEQDLADVLAALRRLPLFNGHAAVIGFCYGGPYAILGPRRLGYQAGIACHGSRMLDYLGDLAGVAAPVCIVWGDQDHLATEAVRDAYRAASATMRNVEVHVMPGVRHGYMMRGNPAAFDQPAYELSMGKALALLGDLRSEHPARPGSASAHL